MEPEKRANIRDVAALAGVSVGTVSRVLSGNPTVKQGPLQRVRDAIEELGFRPNQAARALRSNRVNIIGLLIPDIINPFFAQLANELERVAADAGYALILSTSYNDRDRERRQLAAILEQKPTAVIFVPVEGRPDTDIPAPTRALAIDRRAEGYSNIAVNQKDSAAVALDHLVDLGHRRIAYLAGPDSTLNARERLEGFLNRAEAIRAGGTALDIVICPGEFNYHSGERLARQLLERPSAERVTAIAAASDQQAIGAIRAARDLGQSVPADLSVVGFDDITLASLEVPRLTTVQQPVKEMVEAALHLALDPEPHFAEMEFMGRLVIRDSTAAPPERA